MARKSAYDDLVGTTLEKVRGSWGKLCYLAGRRGTEGTYTHWGFERVHGTAVAQDTFMQAHRSVLAVILRSRLQLLIDDVDQASQAEGVSPASYVARLKEGLRQLLPSGCPRMTELHLVSVLKTLSILETRHHSPPPSL